MASVAIVGAGPAGAALALLLSRAGIRVTLLEREREFQRVFRGEALMPTGLDALYQMGMRERLGRIASRTLESWEIFLDKRLIMQIPEPVAALGELAPRVVSQPELLEAFLAEASRHSGFDFRSPATVRGLLMDGDRVRGVRAQTEQGEVEIEADLVVGADGRASVVRQRAGLELDLLPESYDVLWLKLPCPAWLEGRCPVQIFASGPEVALGYVSWDGRYQLAWMLDKGSWREVRQRDWLVELARILADDLAAHLLGCRDRLERPVLLDVIVGRCPRWHAPGLLLVGDAAHPMSPVRAQGINLALRDAIVAANGLAPALREGRELAPVLAAIQREREREVVKVQRLQWREVRGQRWARERPRLMKLLLRLAPLFARTGFVQRSWLRQQRPLRHGITDVRLRTDFG
jgi:2-polyprenyl-6-methoxyphenol hydroxylase-like FAD-dependent oxidoreductase